MSERGFRKLMRRFREKGDAAVLHGLREHASNRRRTAERTGRVGPICIFIFELFWSL